MSVSITAMNISCLHACLFSILKDVVTLLNPEVSCEECSRGALTKPNVTLKPCQWTFKLFEKEDETQVKTMSSSTARAIHRSKCTQTTAFKLTTRSVKTQTVIDATLSFFSSMKQPLPASELTPENYLILRANERSTRIAKTSGSS